MNLATELRLAIADPPPPAFLRQAQRGTGFSAERVVIGGEMSFDYAWESGQHYLALHDLRLTDGEILVDGLARERTRDLRGTLTFVPPGCAVSGWSVLGRRTDAFTVLSFDPGRMSEELGHRFAQRGLDPRVYFRSEAVRAPLGRLGDLVGREPADPLHVESLALLTVIELLGVAPPESPGRLSPRQLAAATAYIEAHLADQIALSDLAGAAGLSRFHFSRAFKASTGKSPYAFVLDRRVERAEELLASSDLPLEALATASGFAGVAQLRRAYRDIKGRSLTAGRTRDVTGDG